MQKPQSVKCEPLPDKIHASAFGSLVVFSEEVTYSCEAGYTTDGKAAGDGFFIGI